MRSDVITVNVGEHLLFMNAYDVLSLMKEFPDCQARRGRLARRRYPVDASVIC